MNRCALLIGLVLITFGPAIAQEINVFSGCPQIKYEITQDKAERTKVEKLKQSEFICSIVRIGDKYYWKSRGNREMVMTYTAGAGTCYFIDPTGGGSVKVTQEGKEKIRYIEQISLGLTFVIYYGAGEYLRLEMSGVTK